MAEKIKVLPTLQAMKVGDEVEFPISRLMTVQGSASKQSLVLDRKYSTRTDRERKVVIVTRNA